MTREHDDGPIACPKCGGETVPQEKNRVLCPTCGALGEWFAWCGSTDQGFSRLASTHPMRFLPHVTVVG